jgi:hypothetical protein
MHFKFLGMVPIFACDFAAGFCLDYTVLYIIYPLLEATKSSQIGHCLEGIRALDMGKYSNSLYVYLY